MTDPYFSGFVILPTLSIPATFNIIMPERNKQTDPDASIKAYITVQWG